MQPTHHSPACDIGHLWHSGGVVAAPAVTDPRVIRTRATVMRTASELLVEGGPAAVTIDAITARSGIAKTTIYRHWPTHEALIVALFSEVAPTMEAPPADLPAPEALRALCRLTVDTMAGDQWERLLPALLLVKLRYGSVAEIEEQIHDQMAEAVGTTLTRLVERGEIRLHAPVEQSMHLLLGPLVMARLLGSFPVDHAFAHHVADQFYAAVRVGRG